MSNLGGWTPETLITEEARKICREVKPAIEMAIGTNFPVYIPKSFRLKVEAGINYLVKVCVAEDVCVHAMIFRDFQGKLKVTGVQYRKALSPLVYF